MKIQALAALERGQPVVPWTYDSPDLMPHEVIIKVKACGICYSDIHMIDNDWRGTKYPLVPGHEIVGEVVECGREVKLKPGARVGVGWQRSSCLHCDDCLAGNENLCAENKGVIQQGHGGFADYLVMDSRFSFVIPDALPSEETAPLLCGGITVYAALVYAGMTHGKHIGVIGLGGLGHMAVQFASRLGNDVTVFSTSENKAAEAGKLGAKEVLVNTGPRIKSKPKRPLDIIISTVYHSLQWTDYIKLLGSDGTFTFVGVPSDDLQIPIGLLLGKRRRIMGSPTGGRAIISRMLKIAADNGIGAVIEKFPMSAANEAITRVRENKIRYRAVLTT